MGDMANTELNPVKKTKLWLLTSTKARQVLTESSWICLLIFLLFINNNDGVYTGLFIPSPSVFINCFVYLFMFSFKAQGNSLQHHQWKLSLANFSPPPLFPGNC